MTTVRALTTVLTSSTRRKYLHRTPAKRVNRRRRNTGRPRHLNTPIRNLTERGMTGGRPRATGKGVRMTTPSSSRRNPPTGRNVLMKLHIPQALRHAQVAGNGGRPGVLDGVKITSQNDPEDWPVPNIVLLTRSVARLLAVVLSISSAVAPCLKTPVVGIDTRIWTRVTITITTTTTTRGI